MACMVLYMLACLIQFYGQCSGRTLFKLIPSLFCKWIGKPVIFIKSKDVTVNAVVMILLTIALTDGWPTNSLWYIFVPLSYVIISGLWIH